MTSFPSDARPVENRVCFARRAAILVGISVVCAAVNANRTLAQDALADAAPGAARHQLESDQTVTLISHEQITNWIAELSHDAYPIRQAAAERLLEAGTAAREPLQNIVDGPDPEIRAAARRLVALIERTDFQRQLEAFAGDRDGRLGLSLPGWEPYSEHVGDDPAARALFVEMQRHEGGLLAAAFDNPSRPLNGIWEERLVRLVQWQLTVPGDRSVPPPLGTCATMLLLASVPEIEVSDRAAMFVENLIQRPPVRENLQAGSFQDAVRRLVAGWILRCPNRNEVLLNRRLYLASTNQLHEALPLAFQVARAQEDYSRAQPATRAAAILLVGQLGGREHIEKLEPLLDDATVCAAVGPGQSATHVQLRDVALVVILHLAGEQPAEYGFVHARMQPQQMFQLQTLSIESNQQRDRALAKWQQWKLQRDRETGAGGDDSKSPDD